jgi:hypothetical protein
MLGREADLFALVVAAAIVGILVTAPSLATSPWETVPSGEAGFVEHIGPMQSGLTREQQRAREADEFKSMSARGRQWNQLLATYQTVGPAAPAVLGSDAGTQPMTRQQVRAREAKEFDEMAAKGYRWNQLLSTYQYVGKPR